MSLAVLHQYVMSSLSDLEQQSMARRGLDDGLDGKPPRSEAEAYGRCYLRGSLFRRAAAFEVAVTFGPAFLCPSCRSVYAVGPVGRCHCTSHGTALVWGMAALHGPGSPDDDLQFWAHEQLKALVIQGVEVVTMDGERLNEQILLH